MDKLKIFFGVGFFIVGWMLAFIQAGLFLLTAYNASTFILFLLTLGANIIGLFLIYENDDDHHIRTSGILAFLMCIFLIVIMSLEPLEIVVYPDIHMFGWEYFVLLVYALLYPQP